MALTVKATEPITISNVARIDDAGKVQYESVWTGEYIKALVDAGLLRFENNIRPDHMEGVRMRAKTRNKIDKWAHELLAGDAVIGNLSVRVDPNASTIETEVDDEEGQENLVVDGHLDTAVDSESRLKAIMKALSSPMGDKLRKTRFAVRIWVADDDLAKRVAANYNTRGDKVNDSAAKFAYQETFGQRLARFLVDGSKNLGIDNVEVLSNTVSGNSSKLAAFNTFAHGLELYWHGEAVTADDEQAQGEFLIRFWDALAKVRPEYGRLTKAARLTARDHSVSGTGISIHGLVAVASELYARHVVDSDAIEAALKPLGQLVAVDGGGVDYFSYDNPVWTSIGVLVPGRENENGERALGIRTTFQTRDAMAAELIKKLGLTVTGPLRQK